MSCSHTRGEHYLVWLEGGRVLSRCNLCDCSDQQCPGVPTMIEQGQRAAHAIQSVRLVLDELVHARNAISTAINVLARVDGLGINVESFTQEKGTT